MKTINFLLRNNTNKDNILYFSFDEKSADIKIVIDAYITLKKKNLREERFYFFFDEIQKVEDWQNKIKKYYDLYHRL